MAWPHSWAAIANEAIDVPSYTPSDYYLDDEEYIGAKRMLSAAALTYVAAMISTLMSMLRIFLMIAGRSRDD